MNLLINKKGKTFDIVINEDLKGTIDGKPAKFDPLYNAMVLEEGYVIEDMYVNGLRIDPKNVNEILKINKKFLSSYDKHVKEQKEYIPKIVRLNGETFVYTNPFNPVVVISDMIEKLNLLIYKCDQSLLQKVVDLMDKNGDIKTEDLLKLPEYKDYIKSLRKYEKIKQKYAEKEAQFNKLIEGKQKVGLDECNNCNEYFIIGNEKGKFLAKTVFFQAKNEWLDLVDENDNEYSDFCLGMTDNYVYLKIGNAEECPMCKL